MTETQELKPCPGCGKDHTRVIGGLGTASNGKYWAGCDICHWRTWGDTQAEAIEQWNTRQSTTPSVDAEVVEVLRKVTDSLEAELQARYPVEAEGHSPYPVLKRQYDRDMAEVHEARALLTRLGDANDQHS